MNLPRGTMSSLSLQKFDLRYVFKVNDTPQSIRMLALSVRMILNIFIYSCIFYWLQSCSVLNKMKGNHGLIKESNIILQPGLLVSRNENVCAVCVNVK